MNSYRVAPSTSRASSWTAVTSCLLWFLSKACCFRGRVCNRGQFEARCQDEWLLLRLRRWQPESIRSARRVQCRSPRGFNLGRPVPRHARHAL